jgi:hypothetical protein
MSNINNAVHDVFRQEVVQNPEERWEGEKACFLLYPPVHGGCIHMDLVDWMINHVRSGALAPFRRVHDNIREEWLQTRV